MRILFLISGAIVGEAASSVVPAIGTEVIFRMSGYKKGHWPGTVLRFTVSDEFPPLFDFTVGEPTVHIDVNEWTVLEEGPSQDEQD